VRVGLVINPIAGMGGAVGLKGTDSSEILAEAIRRGARPQAEERTYAAIKAAGELFGYDFITASGSMGEDVLRRCDAKMTVVQCSSEGTTDRDTLATCSQILQAGVDLLLFAGGDGTARDVMDVVGERVPVIGIPCGVKMQSGVFANTPQAAGVLLRRYRVEGLPSKRAEVMDIDEEEVRQGRINTYLYGYMLTPDEPNLMQPFKLALGGRSDEENKIEVAKFFVENIQQGILYILGPGTTLEAVGRLMNIDKTLLGVDLVVDGQLLGKDVDERSILSALDRYPEARIVVTPIGAQGFIFGRGNQQISAKVIQKVGVRNVVILATPQKMRETRTLRVDTGDEKLDDILRGYGMVVIGYAKQLTAPID
jgi:predicted polyphosphate/ATP-dependent NAD kinase